jgi:hypothetical protein
MSCAGFFDEYVNWVTIPDPRPHLFVAHLVECTLVSNQKNGVCSYAFGEVSYTPPRVEGEGLFSMAVPGFFEGDLD